jgi:UrcA family protein
MNRLLTTVALGTLALCPGLACYASTKVEARSGTRTETVRFADLDLSQPRGAAVLYARLKEAAQHVCRDLESGRQLAQMAAHADCVRRALGDAITEVNRPVLTRYALERGVLALGQPTVALTY